MKRVSTKSEARKLDDVKGEDSSRSAQSFTEESMESNSVKLRA